jgi:hypothetical protein
MDHTEWAEGSGTRGSRAQVAVARCLAGAVLVALISVASLAQMGPVVASAAPIAATPATSAAQVHGSPLSAALSRSGALTAAHGSYNASGYHMSLGPGGAPRFSTSSSGPGDSSWSNAFGNSGIYGASLTAVAVSGSDVYVGGNFSKLNWDSPIVPANNIAHWDGHGWSSLGTGTHNGTNGTVLAIAVSGSTVYAGGDFTTAGGAGANYVASWNGTAWSPLGGGMSEPSNQRTPEVNALTLSGSTLYAGGTFDDAGLVVVHSVAAWNGATWSALAGGLTECSFFDTPNHCFQVPGTGQVKALVVSGSSLYAGGGFNLVGGTEVFSLAVWNGSAWAAVGGASVIRNTGEGTVNGLAVAGTTLYIAGIFDQVGAIGGPSVSAASVASWNGTQWSPLGSGATACCGDATVAALTYWSGHLYMSGSFQSAGGDGQTNTAVWNGSSWTAINPNLDGAPTALQASPAGVIAVGTFGLGGTKSLNDIGRWNGTVWQGYGLGLSVGSNAGDVSALGAAGHDLYAGGNFLYAGATAALNMAHLSSSAWDTMAGANGDSLVLAVAVVGSHVYVGGAFSQIGGVPATNIAMWDGTAWHALGSGTDGQVKTLLVYGGKVWVGGSFTHAGTGAASAVAIWDPIAQTWSRVGGGLNFDGQVYALAGLPAPNQHFVVIGGSFLQVDDGNATGTGTQYATVNGLVYFDTTATISGPLSGYHTMGGGVTLACSFPPCTGAVYALLVDGVTAYVGGSFDDAGAVASRGFAAFNLGTLAWSSPGVVGGGDGSGSEVDALMPVGTTFYVGGDFTSAGGINANYIASYSPGTATWSVLGSGVSGRVESLAQSSDGLYVGGHFSVAGVNPAQNLALWTATAVTTKATTTSVASSLNPATTSQAVTYTATVAPTPDGGTVAFTDNTVGLTGCGAVVVSATTGKAACTTTYGSAGSHTIMATYSGDPSFASSGGSLKQTVYLPLTGRSGVINAVSADSATDAWAVGSFTNATTKATETLTMHWTGTGWTAVSSPNAGGTTSSADVTTLTGVTAISPTNAWAVGSYVNPAGQARQTLILHWNGSAWSTAISPNPGGTSSSTNLSALTGVSADSPTDAWAVGNFTSPTTGASETLATHWNGTVWSLVASPNPGGTAAGNSSLLTGVSARTATDVWAVGNYTAVSTKAVETQVLHWNGTSWTTIASPSPGGSTISTNRSTLSSVSADSATDAWAAGSFVSPTTHATLNLTEHWNGTSWVSVSNPSPGGTTGSAQLSALSGVSADKSTDAWAVGTYTNPATLAVETQVLRWNGTTWAKVVSPSPGGSTSAANSSVLNGVIARPGTDAWTVGAYSLNRALILHWNGTSWTSA